MHRNDHIYRINEVLNRIHRDISGDLRAKTLANYAAFSEQYFHRLFKKVTGETVHHYVRRTRLETAANLLMFSPELTTQQIAETCGYLSLSSFSHAFKASYQMTPGEWRMTANSSGKRNFLSDPDIHAAYQRLEHTKLPTPEIVQRTPQKIAYIRHKGYGRSIAQTWRTMQAWAMHEQRSMDIQIGLHHSNPVLMPLQSCHYVVCIGIDSPIIRRGIVNSAMIPGGLHAMFQLSGRYGELLPYVSKIQHEWLPNSGYIAKTTPAFAIYQKNQFLSDDDRFVLQFYLPIMPF